MGYGNSSMGDGDSNPGSGFVAETGFKFRLRVDWPWRILGAGYEFSGVRLGVRASGFNQLKDFRFVAEFGAGLW
jgi:hypothetical protein